MKKSDSLPRVHTLITSFCMAIFGFNLSAQDSSSDQNYEWPHYANDQGSSKYAALDQIDRDTVKDLEVAWIWGSVDNAQIELRPNFVPAGFKATPIQVDGTLYLSTSLGNIVALDAKSGAQKWTFDTRTWEDGRPANMGFNHRGVDYWEEGDKKRIIMGTNNAYLWSIDAETGLPDMSFGTDGRVDLTIGLGREIDRSKYSIGAAPTIVNNTVVLGGIVQDSPVMGWEVPAKQTDMPPGHIRGFDVETGEMKWIFHSIPQAGEVGNETWENDSWKVTGSTNVWTLMSADPELGYVYLPFGTPSNDWYGGQRLGDNLFATSIVCLDASTGELVWYFQTTHHELWDYDLPAAPNLVDITVDGKEIKALAQISKQGFVYVLDRVTGEPVWPIEERPVPASTVPGERTAATQPFPSLPAAFDIQGISEDDLIDFTPELREEALVIINQYEHGGLYMPPSLGGTIQIPGDGGGGEWTGAAFDPETSMLYIPAMTRPIVVQLIATDSADTEFSYVRNGGTGTTLSGPQGLPLMKPPYGRISAINLNTGEYEWVVPNGEGRRQAIIDMGIPDPGPVGLTSFVTTLVTKSLLFVAITDGTPKLKALDKVTGETIYEVELPGIPQGSPMSYMIDGKQYISIAAGGGNDASLITLALP